ncbi:MAG: VOC family protein [Eubacteriales bacterium]|nr:VOC family protein [Eubacteriales bacterium]
MLIPHLHFCGECEEAIALYERAFKTEAKIIDSASCISANGRREIAHAVMKIHGQEIFLNDRFGTAEKTTDIAVHLVILFDNTDELLACYEIMKPGSVTVDPLAALPYSKQAVQFIDRYGVQWGFMVYETRVLI